MCKITVGSKNHHAYFVSKFKAQFGDFTKK
jgi:hypothetical protein